MSMVEIKYDYQQFQSQDSHKVPLIASLEKDITKAKVVDKLIRFIKEEALDEREVEELSKIFKV